MRMNYKKIISVLLVTILLISLIPSQYTKAERVYGNGAWYGNANSQRTNSYLDQTVKIPLGRSWVNSLSTNVPTELGYTITKYRVYYGDGYGVRGVNNQTGATSNGGDYEVGNPFYAHYNSSYGTVTSSMEIAATLSSDVDGGNAAIYVGTSDGFIGKMDGWGIYQKNGAQSFKFSPKAPSGASAYFGGAIKYITYPNDSRRIASASDYRLHMTNTDNMTRTWYFDVDDIPNSTYTTGDSFTGLTTLNNDTIFATTDHNSGSSYGLVFDQASDNFGDWTVHMPTKIMKYQGGIPKNASYDKSSNTIVVVDKQGRVYFHSDTGTNRANRSWLYTGDSLTRGYDSVGGALIHEGYAYTSSKDSSQGTGKGTITKFDLSRLGNEYKTNYVHDQPITTTPIMLSGYLYFGDSTGKVYALDPNTMKRVQWYGDDKGNLYDTTDVGSAVKSLLGADNHLFVSTDSLMVGFKGRPDFVVQKVNDGSNNTSLDNNRYNFTSTLPTISIKGYITNQGTFDYGVYDDFGGVNHQKTVFSIQNTDSGVNHSVDTSKIDSPFSKSSSPYHSESRTGNPNYFQVPVNSPVATMTYPFKPSEEGEYRFTFNVDADPSEKHSEFNEYNNEFQGVFKVVDMNPPDATSERDKYLPNQSIKFTLSKTQKYSYSSYDFTLRKKGGSTVYSQNGTSFPSTLSTTNAVEEGTYEYRLRIKNRYGDYLYSDWKTLEVSVLNPDPGPSQNFAPIPNFIFDQSQYYKGQTIGITSKASDPDGDTITHLYTITRPDGSSYTTSAINPSITNAERGSYKVKQVVTDEHGASANITKTVQVVNRPPNALFTTNKTNYKPNETVTITDQSNDPDSDSLSYAYEVTKPNGSKLFYNIPNPSFKVDERGTYTIKETVTDPYNASDSYVRTIQVINSPPVSDFLTDKNNYYSNDTINITDRSSDPDGDTLSVSYEITRPNGTKIVSTLKNPTIGGLMIGEYTIKQTVTDPYGLTDSTIKKVEVLNRKPIANFIINPNPTDRLTTVQITDKSSDPEGQNLTYKYEYRLNGTSTWKQLSTNANPSFKFPTVDTYEVRLTVTDTFAASDSIIKLIDVENRLPVADFSSTPNPTDRIRTVQFTDKSSDPEGDPLTHKYDYRKKGTSSWTALSNNANPSYKFPNVGTYEVRLTVSDPYNSSAFVIKEIIVNNLSPNSDFIMNPSPSDRLTTVSITNKSSDPENDSLTYKYEYKIKGTSTWKQLSTSVNPSFKFPTVDTYEVRLTVTDSLGASDSSIQEIKINNLAPNADFTSNPNPTNRLTNVVFTDKSTDPEGDSLTHKYEYRKKGSSSWTFLSGNGNHSYTFSEVGTYEVRLTVTDSYGANDFTLKEITVNNLDPKADFLMNPNPTDRLTEVNITSSSSDPEGDLLNHKYEYRIKGTSSWTMLSNAANPKFTFSTVNTYEVRLTVTDTFGASNSKIKEMGVKNLKPNANFTMTPIPTDRLTTVQFKDKSTDPEGDSLTHKYEYRIKGNSGWTALSSNPNPSFKFPTVNTYEVRLTVTDSPGESDSIINEIKVENLSPSISVSHSPTDVFEGDNAQIKMIPIDPDNDKLTVILEMKSSSGWNEIYKQENVASNSPLTYTIANLSPTTYELRATVIDSYGGSGTKMYSFRVTPLEIHGAIEHTTKWKEYHEEQGNPLEFFYSGEKFITKANVTDHPIKNVKVDFKGIQVDNSVLDMNVTLSSQHPIYSGEIYAPEMSAPKTKLAKGKVTFLFTAEWQNGTIKKDLVTVHIIDDVYQAYDFHKTN